MDIKINRVILYIQKIIKNTTRSFNPQPIELKAYNKLICPVRTVVEYIKAIEKIRNLKTLLSVTINTILPLHKLSQDIKNKHSKQQGSTLHCLQPTLQDIPVHQRHS